MYNFWKKKDANAPKNIAYLHKNDTKNQSASPQKLGDVQEDYKPQLFKSQKLEKTAAIQEEDSQDGSKYAINNDEVPEINEEQNNIKKVNGLKS